MSDTDIFGGGKHQVNSVIKQAEEDIELADGSTLFLAEAGQLTYASDFEKDEVRRVKLSGQAFFEIFENKAKPFIIETSNASVEVTGTSFVVKESEGRTEVIVRSGSVKLKKNNELTHISLVKGEVGIASSSSEGLIKRKNEDVNYLSWMTGSFEFNSLQLEQVFELLEERYHVDINVKKSAIENCKYSATFSDRSVDDILAIIGESLGLTVKQNGDTYTIDGKGCQY